MFFILSLGFNLQNVWCAQLTTMIEGQCGYKRDQNALDKKEFTHFIAGVKLVTRLSWLESRHYLSLNGVQRCNKRINNDSIIKLQLRVGVKKYIFFRSILCCWSKTIAARCDIDIVFLWLLLCWFCFCCC